MMEKGKKTCKVLKEIRQQIADANEIKYAPRECHHEGPCAGTCPACEAEVRYLENELQMRRILGRAVVLTGIAAGMTSLTACAQKPINHNGCENDSTYELAGDVVMPDVPLRGKIPEPVDSIRPIDNDDQRIYGIVDDMQPQFPGGTEALMRYIKEKRQYPVEAIEEGIEGKVFVSFFVEKDGSLTDIKVMKSVNPQLDKEALRIVKSMPKWIPGRRGGEPFRMRYNIPVVFKFD